MSEKNNSPTPTSLYKEVVDITGRLVAERYTEADWLYREANHSLQKDADSVSEFTAILNQNPRDSFALEGLLYVCTEYQFDLDCAFSAAQQYVDARAADDPEALPIYLDAAEIAVIKGQDTQAKAWLNKVLAQNDLEARLKAIARFYEVWLALQSNSTHDAQENFAEWLKALADMRASHTDVNWVFNGAKHVLESNAMSAANKKLLRDMIHALEDSSTPIPKFSPT